MRKSNFLPPTERPQCDGHRCPDHRRESQIDEDRSLLCRRTGHLSRDCPNFYQTKKEVPKPADPKKWKGKEMAAHIRTLLASMDEEEKDEFFKTTAEEGF